jgi:hypothetical protein
VIALLFACAPGPTPEAADGTPPVDTGVPEPVGDPATVGLEGACPDDTRYARFTVEANPEYAAASGSGLDGVVPQTILTEVETEGECTMWRRENPYCSETCASDQTCDFDGTCVAYPRAADLGAVTIGGLVAPVRMEPAVPGYLYTAELDNPPFSAGALVELRTADAGFPAATAHGVGVEDLALTASTWALAPGAPFELEWTAPEAGARSTLHVEVNVDQHGNTPITMVCEMADDGEGELPAALLESTVAAGVSGYPNARVARRTADRTALGDGCLEFLVQSVVLPDVSVDGYVACSSSAECPPGMSCNTEIELCE